MVSCNKAAKACDDINSDSQCSWVMGSRSSRHLVGDEYLLQDAFRCDSQDGITLPNDEKNHVTKFGKVTFETVVDDDIHEVTLSDGCYTPSPRRICVLYHKAD